MAISAPTDLANCRWWLDADDATTFSFYSATNISQWNDKSGNATHARDFGGSDPATRSGTQNGRTTVVFGSTFGSGLGEDSGVSLSQPLTVCMAAKLTSTTWGGLFSAAGAQLRRSGADNTKVLFDAGSAADFALDTSWHLITAIFNGASSKQRIDKVEVGTTNTGTSGGSRLLVGADNDFNHARGEIGEIVVYTDAKSGTDLTDLEDYLYNKWFGGGGGTQPPRSMHQYRLRRV